MIKPCERVFVSAYGTTVYLIDALLFWIFLVGCGSLVFGLFAVLMKFHAPNWLLFLFYLVCSCLPHFTAAVRPYLYSRLRQTIKYSLHGLTVFRLLQAGAFIATAVVVWFVWLMWFV